MGRLPTLDEAFHPAIVDAINTYVRGVLGRRRLLTQDYLAGLGADELFRAKHDLAQDLAARLGRLRFDLDGNPIGSLPDDFPSALKDEVGAAPE